MLVTLGSLSLPFAWRMALLARRTFSSGIHRQAYVAQQNSSTEIMALTGFKSRATFYKYVVNAERQE